MKTAARQLLRAIRGSEPQVGFSSRLGYRTNVAAEWEGGRRFPNALELLRICAECDIDAVNALQSLAPAHAGLVRADDLGPWFDALRGDRSQLALARRADRSRHQLRRWLTGTAVPRIPDLLVLLDVLTGRPATFAASLVGAHGVPALRARLRREQSTQREQRDAHLRSLKADVQTALARAGVDNVTIHALPIDEPGLRQLETLAKTGLSDVEPAHDSDTLGLWVVGARRQIGD
jgi:transcriptional regulator with XRE-family HTH domain